MRELISAPSSEEGCGDGDPGITAPVVSRKIFKAMSLRAKTIVAHHRTTSSLPFFCQEGDGAAGMGTGGGGRKRSRRHSAGAASLLSLDTDETRSH